MKARREPPALLRELGVTGATLMGLGSIVGTGVFVSLGIAAGAAGPAVVLAIAVAAFVALCNALSSAQLAASHPVSGGTYEYGYRYLHPALGFTAGWMFLCAKSASAATAALGFAGYLLHVVGRGRGGRYRGAATEAGAVPGSATEPGASGVGASVPGEAGIGDAAGPGAAAGPGTDAVDGAGWLAGWLGGGEPEALLLVAVAAATAIVLTLLVAGGMRRSKIANGVIVSVTLLALAAFVAAGLPVLLERGTENLVPFLAPVDGGGGGRGPVKGFLYACALMFVAYTGYGRIATLGEEVREPRRTIPRAIVATLVVTSVLYAAVGLVAVGTVGAGALYAATEGDAAPLEIVARAADFRVAGVGVHALVAVGALTALLGVLLNLLLGLSRVALAMGRRGDLPAAVAKLEGVAPRNRPRRPAGPSAENAPAGMVATAAAGEERAGAAPAATSPRRAVLLVGAVVTLLTLLGDVELTWSFSAFTVLVYYALTNLAALRLPPEDRLYPRFFPRAGLAACVFLAFWVDPAVWLTGLALIAAGLGWHVWRRR